MSSKELQTLTASESLTLEEEYEMQKSWQDDEDSNFLILLYCIFINSSVPMKYSMIGDTNIFIKDKQEALGEIEIMIAEESVRGKKLGWESVILMLIYGIQILGLKIYEAKISITNIISLKMFHKLGFEEKSVSDVFQEITLEKVVTQKWSNWLQEQYKLELVALNK
ncbi:unnamed protein product [Diatraea saccharalis]|uniref:N-acetyltransferase domain-containing protein n=1 Tax=Diatraea saccharalis TaxID=40085 RepID=A0A9N9N0P7_9NEOP|nr:unnamed protein product [Diatraea saccharalis]